MPKRPHSSSLTPIKRASSSCKKNRQRYNLKQCSVPLTDISKGTPDILSRLTSAEKQISSLMESSSNIQPLLPNLQLLSTLQPLIHPAATHDQNDLLSCGAVVSAIASELFELTSRARNVIAFNVPDRKNLKSVKSLVSVSTGIPISSFTVTRLRKSKPSLCCPILFRFINDLIASDFRRMENLLKDLPELHNLSLKCDFTPLQREVKRNAGNSSPLRSHSSTHLIDLDVPEVSTPVLIPSSAHPSTLPSSSPVKTGCGANSILTTSAPSIQQTDLSNLNVPPTQQVPFKSVVIPRPHSSLAMSSNRVSNVIPLPNKSISKTKPQLVKFKPVKALLGDPVMDNTRVRNNNLKSSNRNATYKLDTPSITHLNVRSINGINHRVTTTTPRVPLPAGQFTRVVHQKSHARRVRFFKPTMQNRVSNFFQEFPAPRRKMKKTTPRCHLHLPRPPMQNAYLPNYPYWQQTNPYVMPTQPPSQICWQSGIPMKLTNNYPFLNTHPYAHQLHPSQLTVGLPPAQMVQTSPGHHINLVHAL